MSDAGDKYKWTPESTQLLVSVWTDRQVQKQLEYTAKPQLIWESVARYMNKKGYNVSGKQCRSRMKQVLVCYREAKRAGTRAGVEQYYESIDRVLKAKRHELANDNGVDTVDSTANVKSPPKDVKTNKNLQMRYKYQQPAESIYRTEALSPIWNGRDSDYPESPESNETVLAQPFRVLSPVKDAATNTTQQQLGQMNKKITPQNGIYEEAPIKETYRQSIYSNKYFNDIPFQNTVQNVQNQIIQENMQQNQAMLQQNLLQNQLLEHNRLQMNPIMRQNIQNVNQGLYTEPVVMQCNQGFGYNSVAENVLQMQSKMNRAMPQEPRKQSFRQNLAANYRQFQDIGPHNYNGNLNHIGFLSPSISPDIPPNLNEAFCQTKNEKLYSRPSSNQMNLQNQDVTTMTNNATFNDDTISIEFLQDSPTPDSEPRTGKSKDFAVNTEDMPNAPLRKKKAEKLERLMMSAINSQNEVVNKILAAQNDMVTRVLDLDRDRQNRLENRLDHLLDVVQTAVLNKSSEKGSECSAPLEPLITNLQPPPKPGTLPPKLDLVPPKPCRVPCRVTISSTTQQTNTITTRPGVVSPIVCSPSTKVGAIWQKLGPVSTSPFVRAQQQLGFRPVHAATNDVRTQSSAERRIAKEFETGMDTKTLIFETENFLDAERKIQAEVENARIKYKMGQELQSRRRLFTQREPTAAMILSAAFLEEEAYSTESNENARLEWIRQRQMESEREFCNRPIEQWKYDNYNAKRNDEKVLAGQGESYERLRQLSSRDRALVGDPCESSTPAKLANPIPKPGFINVDEPRQTIQQLAQMVMNSARWRQNAENQRKDLNIRIGTGNIQKPSCPEDVILRNTGVSREPVNDNRQIHQQQVDSKAKTLDWLQDRYSYGGQTSSSRNNAVAHEVAKRLSYDAPKPMGFTNAFLNNEENNNNNNLRQIPTDQEKRVGFTTAFLNAEENSNKRRSHSGEQEKRVGFACDNNLFIDEERRNRFVKEVHQDPFEELHQFYIQKQLKQQLPFMVQNGKVILPQGDMIDKFMQEANQLRKNAKESDSDNDEEFLDTTASMPSSRKNSLTSTGSKPGKEQGCVIS